MEYNDDEAVHESDARGMAVYYLFLLKKGPAWSPDLTPEIGQLQSEHLANLNRRQRWAGLSSTVPA